MRKRYVVILPFMYLLVNETKKIHYCIVSMQSESYLFLFFFFLDQSFFAHYNFGHSIDFSLCVNHCISALKIQKK